VTSRIADSRGMTYVTICHVSITFDIILYTWYYEFKLKYKSKRIILYSVYTRELNKVLSIIYLPYICWAHGLCYTKPSLL